MDEYYDSNIELWNEWTEIHKNTPGYNLQGFIKGGSKLHSLERDELGDVAGKSLLHLQCHFGLDTLSWARLGALVTGVDFSDKAIALAKKLTTETKLLARFIRSNVFDLPDLLDEQFDIVFTSYGALYWLDDIPAWGKLVSHYLKPGGVFYVAEFHPFAQIFEESADHQGVRIAYPYFPQAEPLKFDVVGSYANPTAKVDHAVEYGWQHSLSEIINALLSAGLTLEYVHEHAVSVDNSYFPHLFEPIEGRYWRLKAYAESIPLMFSIRAHKGT
jgi:ubiquinone/menaquinone biosynthesis C-methylase UbiE